MDGSVSMSTGGSIKMSVKVCVASWPISVAVMMLRGDPFAVAGLMSLFIAFTIGLLGWSIAALIQRASGVGM